MFSDRLKQLREDKQMPQRQLAAALEIDTATYCKIERGDRHAKREQVIILAKLLNINPEELLNLWLADKVYYIVKDEKQAKTVLNLVQENISEYGK
jgi:transcriptional regulator with XRE-family HTH domain